MKPVECDSCKICGKTRPGQCFQTLFGLNAEKKADVTVLHGNLKKVGA